MTRKCHVGFGEEGACFLPDVNQERRRALTLPIPNASKARCKVAVPLQHEMAYLAPQNRANDASNCSTYFPTEEIHLDLKQSDTYAFSFPTNIGAATGIDRFLITRYSHSLQVRSSNPNARYSSS